MRMRHAQPAALMAVLLLLVPFQSSLAQTAKNEGKTLVVMLGTGTPVPDPSRAGPSTAIIVNSTPYIVDCGTGIVRRAAAARDKGIAALEPKNLRVLFLTHLHSDHALGFADLILTPWVMGRTQPLEVYGPPGTRAMAEHILQAYDIDIQTRTHGLEQSNHTSYKVNVHEISPGVVYKDELVKVTAFRAHHGSMDAYGYRFDTPDRSVVISGDTTPDSQIPHICQHCDVLIHEVYTVASVEKVAPQWKHYRKAFHTSTSELADIADKAKPKLLVIYHRGNAGCDQSPSPECRAAGSEQQVLKEIQAHYAGNVAVAHDLDVY